MTQVRKCRTAEKKERSKKRVTAAQSKAVAAPAPDPSTWQKQAFGPAIERQAQFRESAVVSMEGGTVKSPHSDAAGFTAMLSTAMGSRSEDWTLQAINWLTNAARARGQTDDLQGATNAALAFMTDVAPESAVEASLALQMYATHTVAMDMLQRCKQSTDRQALNEFANIATKMTRTFSGSLEALAKLRRNGEQVVRHVHVYEGGQAVVAGTINHGGQIGKGSGQPHGKTADAPLASLPGPDEAQRDAVSIASDAERAVLPARG